MLVNANDMTGREMRQTLDAGFAIIFEWRGSLKGASRIADSLKPIWADFTHYAPLHLTVCRFYPLVSRAKH